MLLCFPRTNCINESDVTRRLFFSHALRAFYSSITPVSSITLRNVLNGRMCRHRRMQDSTEGGCRKGLRLSSSERKKRENFLTLYAEFRYLLTLNDEVLLQHFLLIFVTKDADSMHKIRFFSDLFISILFFKLSKGRG